MRPRRPKQYCLQLDIALWCKNQIDHFRITFGLFFKASLGAHRFIWKLVFIHMQMKTNFHMKRWAPGIALKKRPKVIRKWPIEHSIWDESLLLSNCARSLEYSSSSTVAGLSYHICGKLEVAFKASPSSQHQHCTDEAQMAETVLSAVIYIYIYIF